MLNPVTGNLFQNLLNQNLRQFISKFGENVEGEVIGQKQSQIFCLRLIIKVLHIRNYKH